MQTNLAQWAHDLEAGQEAEEILRRCVHCGFCLATCPTYQLTGDERDSPRGRIYLIKELLEGQEVSRPTQHHLDRCLTCRNCETTCPSGVEYGKLVDIGRDLVEERVKRPLAERVTRGALRRVINSPILEPAVKAGRMLRPLLPEQLKGKLQAPRAPGELPTHTESYSKQVLLLNSCVQSTFAPSIDAATTRVLAHIGIGVQTVSESGCCGAVNFHLDAQEAARQQMRANIDAWLPELESGRISAIVMTASGCGAMVVEYAHHLRHDPDYADKAAKVVEHVVDVAELVAPHADSLREHLATLPERPVFHPPCTLQHWQGLRNLTEGLLSDLGFDLQPFEESHLCCGAAGTYSVTQPEMSRQLRERKLECISVAKPDAILSANMGCLLHLQEGTNLPARHWIEFVDEALAGARESRA